MAVKLMDNKDQWDKFINSSPYGTLFHKWDFLKIMEKHSKYTLYPYGVYRGEELICLFPIFIRNFMGLKMVFSPPPSLAVPYLGFVMSPAYDKLKQRRKETYINSVIDEVEVEIKKLHPNVVNIATVNGFVDVRPFKWNRYDVQMYYSYVIDLKQPLEKIWDDFDTDLKREIRSTENLNLSIRPTDNIDEFYSILEDRFKQQGLNMSISSKEYLMDVLSTFPENVKMNFLYLDDNIVDLIAHYQYNGRIAFWLGWVNLDRKLHSNEFIAWDYIKRMKAEGLGTLEIQGANIKRLCLFKSKFNASLEYGFSIAKKDMIGSFAEMMYVNFIKRRWF